MKKSLSLFVFVLICGFIAACGSGGSQPPVGVAPPPADPPPANPPVDPPPPAPAPPAIRITPETALLLTGSKKTFKAEVTGDPPPPVVWKVEEGDAGGTVTPEGDYTAPETPGTYHIIAADPEDPALFAKSEVVVLSMVVEPAAITLHPGEAHQFSARISGGDTSALFAWSVAEGPEGGTIQEDGTYTAPASAGVYHVVAVAAADSGRSAQATVTVVPWRVVPRFAYAVNSVSNDVSMFSIDSSTGVPTKIGSIAAGDHPYAVAADPSGRFVYAGNFGPGDTLSDISMYSVDQKTGMLKSIGAGTVQAGAGPYSIAIDPSGKYAYVANENSSPQVLVYRIDPSTGELKKVGEAIAGTSAICITVDPLGRFVYVANTISSTVSFYTIDPDTGTLTRQGAVAAGSATNGVVVEPSGRFAYAANYLSDDVWWFRIDPKTGNLSMLGKKSAGTRPFAIAVDPSGRFVYTANSGSDDVSMFRIDPATGALTSLGAIGATPDRFKQWGPRSVTVDPSGQFVYVANMNSSNVSVYRIDPESGALSPVGYFDAGKETRSVTITRGLQ